MLYPYSENFAILLKPQNVFLELEKLIQKVIWKENHQELMLLNQVHEVAVKILASSTII